MGCAMPLIRTRLSNRQLFVAWLGLAVAIIASLSALAVRVVAAEPGTISGVVVDDKGPVAGATVRIQTTTNSTISAEDGSFVLEGIAVGELVTVTAWAFGYYNGVALAVTEAEPVTITLRTYYATDNHLYAWFERDGIEGSLACGTCHTNYAEWQADAHGQAAQNPRFLSIYAGTDVHGNKSPVPEKTNLGIPLPPDLSQPYFGPGFVLDFPNRAGNCATCHTPVAAKMPNNKNCGWAGCHASSTSQQSYGLDPGVSPMPLTGIAAEGITCEFCHKIGDVYINRKTGRPYDDSPGILSYRLFRPMEGHDLLFGTLDDVIGADHTNIKDSFLPLMKESDYCAGCHYGIMGGVVGKETVTGGVLIYNSYGEWLESAYSDPENGKTCQDCHMPAMASGYFVYPEEGGLYRDGSQIHNHKMTSASDPEFLQSAVALTATATVIDGWVWVNVNLFNRGAGHHIPTDSPLRQMLLVVEATDTAGKPLDVSYGPKLPTWAGDLGGLSGKAFAKVLQDEWTGEIPSVAIWRPIRIVEDTRLPALKSDYSLYSFQLPEDLPEDEVTIEVRLLYRRAYQQLAEWKGWNDPDLLMAQQSIRIQVSTLASANQTLTLNAD
jgi:hypothetical protein